MGEWIAEVRADEGRAEAARQALHDGNGDVDRFSPASYAAVVIDLGQLIPTPLDPDSVMDAFFGWVEAAGLTMYPHQEEALLEIVAGSHVIVDTPTGSGKSLIAVAAHFAALADRRRSYYTAPIKALVSEKFFALSATFGADNVGMLTGDASVNPDAPIICCTAEILANLALREGRGAESARSSWTSSTTSPTPTAAGRGRSRCSTWPTHSSS